MTLARIGTLLVLLVASPAHAEWHARVSADHVLVEPSASARVLDVIAAAVEKNASCRGIALSSRLGEEAHALGLVGGECLRELSGHPVTTVAQLRTAAKRQAGARRIYLHLERSAGGERDLIVEWSSDLRRATATSDGTGGKPDTTDEIPAARLAEIRCTGARCELKRSTLEWLFTNPTALAREARIVPHIVDGQPAGFKLFALRAEALFARLGFRNGDTIKRINGRELTNPQQALEVYGMLRSATEIRIDIERQGAPFTLTIAVTP